MNAAAQAAPVAGHQVIPGMWPYDTNIAGPGEGTPRTRALSVYWAAQATDYPVTRFRTKYLAGERLAADKVADWIAEQGKRDGEASWWLNSVPFELLQPVGHHGEGGYLIPADVMRSLLSLPSEARQRRYLWYATPGQAGASVAVRLGAVLDALRTLALDLLLDYPMWRPELAEASRTEVENNPLIARLMAPISTFVLTGYAPLIDEHLFPLPAGSGRRQTDKHLQLAAFDALREKKGMPLAERLAVWNARYPHWRYKNTSNYGWDSREAVRRLMKVIGGSISEAEATEGRGTVRDPDVRATVLAEGDEQVRTSGRRVTGGWSADVARTTRQRKGTKSK